MGDRLYGCDDCLVACPPGRQAAEEDTSNLEGASTFATILRASDQTLLPVSAIGSSLTVIPGSSAETL